MQLHRNLATVPAEASPESPENALPDYPGDFQVHTMWLSRHTILLSKLRHALSHTNHQSKGFLLPDQLLFQCPYPTICLSMCWQGSEVVASEVFQLQSLISVGSHAFDEDNPSEKLNFSFIFAAPALGRYHLHLLFAVPAFNFYQL